ncbi:MAG: hypothetical protein IJO68_04745 [Clostridia bacterium]|nr:hypothetical protein [Clostridia bacterium]
MKIRASIRILSVIALILSFSSCSLIDFFSADSLIRPPRLTGENAALQTAVVESVGTDINLYTPIAGEHRASYILFDMNNDNNDEAVVFYSHVSNSSVVHMHLLSSMNGKWFSVADVIGSGTEVYEVAFFNVDNFQGTEIAVTWSLDDSKREKTLSLYKVASLDANSDSLSSVATVQIADYVCFDIDSDAVNELLYFYYQDLSKGDKVSVRLLDYSVQEEKFVPLSEIQFLHEVSSFAAISFEKSNNDYLIYVDCISGSGSYFTKLIVYDYENSALYLPDSDKNDIYELSLRNLDILCSDFNGDGELEIPSQISYEESYTVGAPEGVSYYLTFIEWFQYDNSDLSSVGKYYFNVADGFRMKIDSLYDDYYFVYDYLNGVTQVRLRNFDEENNVVFSVARAEDSDVIYPLIQEKDGFDIVITAKGEKLRITRDYVLKLIENI